MKDLCALETTFMMIIPKDLASFLCDLLFITWIALVSVYPLIIDFSILT